MLETTTRIFAAALALALAAAQPAQAQTSLPNTDNCVRVSNAPDGSSSSEEWTPRYRVTNSCPRDIDLIWRHNYGLAHRNNVKCSSGSLVTVRPGGSEVIRAGPLPKGVGSRIRYCSQYTRREHQELTGYKGCHASNQPTCP